MRLSGQQIKTIKDTVCNHFGTGARVYLFGSRVDDRKTGGDIDICIQAELPPAELYRRKLEALTDLAFALGERKIDLVTCGSLQNQSPFIHEVLASGVEL